MEFKILVVDDEEILRQSVATIAELIVRKHYPFLHPSIVVAKNGKEALDKVTTNEFDLLITDIMMPKMDGRQLIQKIRQKGSSVPIIALTAVSDEDDVKKIMLQGASNYLQKPLNRYVLEAQIRSFVDGFLRKYRKFNEFAVNLFTPNIFARRVEQFIKESEDLEEFWHYFNHISGLQMSYNPILHLLNEIEKVFIASKIPNSIIIEEDERNYYLSITQIEKINFDRIVSLLHRFNIDKSYFDYNHFLLSLVLPKEQDANVDNSNETNIAAYDEYQIAQILKEASQKERRKVDAKTLLQGSQELFKPLIANILFDLEKLRLGLEKFGNLQSDEYMSGYDEMQKAFRHIKKQLLAMRDFHLLTAVLSILDEMMDDCELSVQHVQKRFLFLRWITIFVQDLRDWCDEVFVKQRAENIYAYNDYFEKTLLALIETMYKEEI